MSDAEDYANALKRTLAKNLRVGRAQLNLNKQELAERASITPKAMTHIEQAKLNLTLLTLAKLSLAIGIDVPTLLQGPEPAGTR